MDITKLKGIIPDKILLSLTADFLTKSHIDGPKRLSNFLGQTEEETGIFTREVENLNYSAQGLANTWPHRYAVDSNATPKVPNALAISLNRNAEAIANNVYADRLGNGDEASGDGSKYRGRGDIQITGKANYQAFQDWVNANNTEVLIDLINNPDLVAQAPYDLLCAAWFFTTNNLWVICDKGVDMGTVTIITKHVNGGNIGLNDRYKYTQQIYAALIS